MELMRPCKFTTSDTDEVFDGWTDSVVNPENYEEKK